VQKRVFHIQHLTVKLLGAYPSKHAKGSGRMANMNRRENGIFLEFQTIYIYEYIWEFSLGIYDCLSLNKFISYADTKIFSSCSNICRDIMVVFRE